MSHVKNAWQGILHKLWNCFSQYLLLIWLGTWWLAQTTRLWRRWPLGITQVVQGNSETILSRVKLCISWTFSTVIETVSQFLSNFSREHVRWTFSRRVPQTTTIVQNLVQSLVNFRSIDSIVVKYMHQSTVMKSVKKIMKVNLKQTFILLEAFRVRNKW